MILSFWTVVWVTYSLAIRQGLGFHPLKHTVIPLPKWSKCYGLPTSTHHAYSDCMNTDIDGFSIAHIVIYYTIGMVVPDQYVLILVVSLITEVYEWWRGWRGRWWQDPAVNLLGYWLGSLTYHKNRRTREISQQVIGYANDDMIFYTAILIGALSLYFHSPHLINFKDKSGK